MMIVYLVSAILALLILYWVVAEIQHINKYGHVSDFYITDEEEIRRNS